MRDAAGHDPVRLPGTVHRALAEGLRRAWDAYGRHAAIGPGQRRARRFAAFGDGSAICFPVTALYGERYIAIGSHTIIGPQATLSAGVSPEHELDVDRVITIGDGCLVGKGSGIVGHRSIEIGANVFTGHHVYVTDANHGYEDLETPIGAQFAPPRPVTIGEGSWIGHGSIVLPGARVGRHVVVGAGSVVSGELPDRCVAVGNPARVVRRHVEGEGWVRACGPPGR